MAWRMGSGIGPLVIGQIIGDGLAAMGGCVIAPGVGVIHDFAQLGQHPIPLLASDVIGARTLGVEVAAVAGCRQESIFGGLQGLGEGLVFGPEGFSPSAVDVDCGQFGHARGVQWGGCRMGSGGPGSAAVGAAVAQLFPVVPAGLIPISGDGHLEHGLRQVFRAPGPGIPR